MSSGNSNDINEIERLMGSRFKKAEPVSDAAFNPPQAKKPERPKKKGQEGIPPIFPIIPEDKLKEYTQEKARAEEPFAMEQHGKFDPELNEMALKEIAEERGISVEELLKSPPDKVLETKVDPMNKSTDIDQELLELELKRKELELLKAKKANEQEEVKKEEKKEIKASPLKTSIPLKKKTKDNPILQKMRQKLSLESIKPAEVEIEGLIFRLMTPPASMHPWIFDKLKAAEAFRSEEILLMTLKNATVCAALVAIGAEGMDYQPIAEVLGLVDSVPDMYSMPKDLRELVAQTLWEMIVGEASIEGLFTLHPDLVLKLYQAYELRFKNDALASSLDQGLHRYICPMEDCPEAYDLIPPESEKVFCKVHGIPMTDSGLTAELRAVPLA